MDSWLYDENQPFIHIEALETFAFLKNKVGTGYYEELIQKYLLDNTHGAIVVSARSRDVQHVWMHSSRTSFRNIKSH